MLSPELQDVAPAQAGVQGNISPPALGSRVRGNDEPL